MTKDEALKLALEALENWLEFDPENFGEVDNKAITAIKEALAQPEPKYHRGNRLICLETEEYCVIHISGTDRQWVKFPDSYIGVYTNEQVAELFELLPKETEQEPVATLWQHGETGRTRITMPNDITDCDARWFKAADLYTTPPQRKPLTNKEIGAILDDPNIAEKHQGNWLVLPYSYARAIEAAHGIKGEA